MLQIEIIAIGNELLLGDVLDSNSHWLCQQLTGMGGRMQRVVQVGDEVAAIANEVHGALERGSDLLIITGGLGPTDDDLTLRAVAAALGRPLAEHPAALAMLEQHYRELLAQGLLKDATLTPARRKMVQFPAGGEALANPVGTAPGVVLREGKTTLVCLPGVPEEMRGIFTGSLAGLLRELLGNSCYAEWAITVHAGEATLAPLLRQVVGAHPEVYVKSHARRVEPGAWLRVRITLSRAGTDPAEVAAGLEAALADLQGALAKAQIAVEKVEK